jgi:hypothetical protein
MTKKKAIPVRNGLLNQSVIPVFKTGGAQRSNLSERSPGGRCKFVLSTRRKGSKFNIMKTLSMTCRQGGTPLPALNKIIITDINGV